MSRRPRARGNSFDRLIADEKSGAMERWRNRKKRGKRRQQKPRGHRGVKVLTVAQLCAMPYDKYLRTDHWLKFISRILRKRGKRCQICGRGPSAHLKIDVHHLNYNRRGREEPSDVEVLCRDCHGIEHEDRYRPRDPLSVEYFSIVGGNP